MPDLPAENCANSAPTTPESTSPLPPVASAALPASQRHARRPSLVTVPAPLSAITAPSRCASAIAAPGRVARSTQSTSSASESARSAASPGCGVKTTVPRRSRAASRCEAKSRIASASITSGLSPIATSRMTILPASRLRPSAGPMTTHDASAIAASMRSAHSAARSTPSASVGSATTVASGRITSASSASGSGTATIARPAPARNAPRAASIAPPSILRGSCAHPPITSTEPNVPLCPAGARNGSCGSGSNARELTSRLQRACCPCSARARPQPR